MHYHCMYHTNPQTGFHHLRLASHGRVARDLWRIHHTNIHFQSLYNQCSLIEKTIFSFYALCKFNFTLTSIPAVRKILIPPAGGPVVVEASVEGAAVEGAAVVSSSVVPTNIINTLNIDLQ